MCNCHASLCHCHRNLPIHLSVRGFSDSRCECSARPACSFAATLLALCLSVTARGEGGQLRICPTSQPPHKCGHQNSLGVQNGLHTCTDDSVWSAACCSSRRQRHAAALPLAAQPRRPRGSVQASRIEDALPQSDDLAIPPHGSAQRPRWPPHLVRAAGCARVSADASRRACSTSPRKLKQLPSLPIARAPRIASVIG
jgi:hypothetical protein